MNKLQELYNQIINPLINDKTLEKIIEIYAKSQSEKTEYYNEIMRHTEKKNIGKWFKLDENMLISYLFNTWKNNIVEMDEQKYNELYAKKGSFKDEDFQSLKNFLKDTKNILTEKEYDEIIEKINRNKELAEAMYKYKFEQKTPNGNADKWIYINSQKLGEKKLSPIKHRLYLNLDSSLVRPLLVDILKEFKRQNLDYLIKYSENASRDDSVILYASDENLPKYIEILKEKYINIQDLRENRDVYKETYNIYAPPLITGVIDRLDRI